jgi:hypothetical protein
MMARTMEGLAALPPEGSVSVAGTRSIKVEVMMRKTPFGRLTNRLSGGILQKKGRASPVSIRRVPPLCN